MAGLRISEALKLERPVPAQRIVSLSLSQRSWPPPGGLRGAPNLLRPVAADRSNEDIERRLPVLATFLGHGHAADTYWRLSVEPELMGLATQRLEQGQHAYHRFLSRHVSPIVEVCGKAITQAPFRAGAEGSGSRHYRRVPRRIRKGSRQQRAKPQSASDRDQVFLSIRRARGTRSIRLDPAGAVNAGQTLREVVGWIFNPSRNRSASGCTRSEYLDRPQRSSLPVGCRSNGLAAIGDDRIAPGGCSFGNGISCSLYGQRAKRAVHPVDETGRRHRQSVAAGNARWHLRLRVSQCARRQTQCRWGAGARV